MSEVRTLVPADQDDYDGRLLDAASPTMLGSLDPRGFNIDLGYQRVPNEKQVTAISLDYSAIAAGTALIARRKCRRKAGRIQWKDFTVDGNTRDTGAINAGVSKVDVKVFYSSGMQYEAMVFKKVNRGRRNLSPLQQYHADLCSKDKDALVICADVNKAGYVISGVDHSRHKLPKNPKEIAAIRALYHVLNSCPPTLHCVLVNLEECFSRKEGINRGDFIEGFSLLYHNNFASWGDRIPRKVVRRLRAYSPQEIFKESRTGLVNYQDKDFSRSDYSRVDAIRDTLDLILRTKDDDWKVPVRVPVARVKLGVASADPKVDAVFSRKRSK